MKITILCKVVDNFGDVGVAWRLARRLLSLKNDLKINFVIDDLASFQKINPQIDCGRDFQVFYDGRFCLLHWQAYDFCHSYFSKDDGEEFGVVLELFQCGRPDWMEKILFDEKLQRTVYTILIDYLTAEPYADDFHCLQSLTRSAKVRKVFFMPGFTAKTGGLVLDDEWEALPKRNATGPVLFFTYDFDWSPLIDVFEKGNKSFFAARGKGFDSFIRAAQKNPQFYKRVQPLDYLSQTEWDKVMKSSSILFIRGEESMSRACLSGIPFVWQAYPQSEDYQLVKVEALLERMKPHFSPEDFEIVKNLWIDFNSPELFAGGDNDGNVTATGSEAGLAEGVVSAETSAPAIQIDSWNENLQSHLSLFLENADRLAESFADFAISLRKNGDLASNLMTFIEKKYIIEK